MVPEHSSIPRPLGSTWKAVPMTCAGCGVERHCLILFTDGKQRCVACQAPLLKAAAHARLIMAALGDTDA